jgi:SAM-dependent methyltransferase
MAQSREPAQRPSLNPIARIRARIALLRWHFQGAHDMERFARERLWRFDVPIERSRHQRILDCVAALLGNGGWGSALEVGCFEGDFTQALAARCSRVVACDVAPTACTRAAVRFQSIDSVEIRQADIVNHLFRERFDVVFAMDVLEAIHGRRKIAVALDNLITAMHTGGLFVVSSCNPPHGVQREWWARALAEGADNIVSLIDKDLRLAAIHREKFPPAPIPGYLDHLIVVYRRIA